MLVGISGYCATLLTTLGLATSGNGVSSQGSNLEAEVKTNFIQKHFVDGMVNAHFLKEPEAQEKLVIFIPGGPGISGKYMHTFAQAVGQNLKMNVVILDLPNHDGSRNLNKLKDIQYGEVQALLLGALEEISGITGGEIALVGHSLGALVALDLVGRTSVKVTELVLADLPTSFDSSPKFNNGLQALGVLGEESWETEEAFRAWWAKIVPLYFHNKPDPSVLAMLTSSTFWIGNERFTQNLPSFEELIKKIEANQISKGILYLEGEYDHLLPLGNLLKISASANKISVDVIPSVGHFPMLEAHEEFARRVAAFIATSH